MLRTTASFTPPTTTNIANSRPAYSAQQQRQGWKMSEGVEATLRQNFETALQLEEEGARNPLQKVFNDYIKRLEGFGDPFTAALDPANNRRLNIIATADSSPEPNPLSTVDLPDKAIGILERLQEIYNETLPRLAPFQD
jgi:hypothetical protein